MRSWYPHSNTVTTELLCTVCFTYYYRRQTAYSYTVCPLHCTGKDTPKLHSSLLSSLPPSVIIFFSQLPPCIPDDQAFDMEGVTLTDLQLPSKSFPHLKEGMVKEAMSEVEREEVDSPVGEVGGR